LGTLAQWAGHRSEVVAGGLCAGLCPAQ